MKTITGFVEGKIKDRLAAEGFNSAGITAAAVDSEFGSFLQTYLANGYQGTMDWMENRSRERRHPNALWPEAKSIVVAAMNYGPTVDPMTKLERSGHGNISVYASGTDYHDLLKKRLKAVARWMAEEWGEDVKVFVDTAPVMEKPLAARAGLGWQGKHTNLVSSEYGSWLFLGVILTTMVLRSDEPHSDQCGTCHRCLDICPTNAFPAPYQLDARKCISYLTIEHKGHIPVSFRKAMGNRIYGCDDCLAVCPWNKFAKASRVSAFHARAELQAPLLGELAALDDAGFRQIFRGSPVKRTGRDRFVRNVLIAIGNSGDPSLVPTCKGLLGDASPLVRAMAVWALSQLVDPQQFHNFRDTHLSGETDEHVRGEWQTHE